MSAAVSDPILIRIEPDFELILQLELAPTSESAS